MTGARAALLLLAAGLAACGFHLAGARPLPEPLAWIYIDVVTPYRVSKPPLDSALRARLLRRGAIVAATASAARSVLRLTELAESREVLSVDSFGKAVEYKLTASVRYELLHDDQSLVTPNVLSVSRDYSFNAQQVLAKEAEEARLQAYMQEELADLLLLQLESLLRRTDRPAPPAVAPAGAPGATPAP